MITGNYAEETLVPCGLNTAAVLRKGNPKRFGLGFKVLGGFR